MKQLFFYIVFIAMLFSACSKENQFEKKISTKNFLTRSNLEKKDILASIDSAHKQWGVLEDSSTFFVSSDLFKLDRLDTAKIVIYEVGTEISSFARKSAQSYFFTFSKETVSMEKMGNYYVARSTKKYIDPVFYCEANNNGIREFPDACNDLKIYGKHVLHNQHDGLLLRAK